MSDNIIKTAAVAGATYFGGPIGGMVAGSLLASESLGRTPSSSNIPAPAAESVTPLPTPNDADVRGAKKKSIATMKARKGRASTILTADTSVSDALGG